MQQKLFSIGEISRIKGISIKALRFYDKIGLLHPYHVDPQSQYRYYHMEQFVLFDIIRAARSMDISPSDLVPMFKTRDSRGLLTLIQSHREDLETKIEELNNAIKGIACVAKTLENAEHDQMQTGVFQRDLPIRHFMSAPYRKDLTTNEIILGFSALDMTISKSNQINNYVTGVYLSVIDGVMEPTAMIAGISEETAQDGYLRVPGGLYLCVVCSVETADIQMKKLAQILEDQKINPSFMLQEELLTDVFAPPSSFEFQVPMF
jgi:MerR family transcriptional activator of bmr gene